MAMFVRLLILPILVVVATSAPLAQSQPLPQALTQMIEAERAFAVRALVVGWKQAFLEYFADSAIGFDGGAGPAKDQIRKNPDPPADMQLLWEPRYGDVSASGDLGYLTGPVRNIRHSRPVVHRRLVDRLAGVWVRPGWPRILPARRHSRRRHPIVREPDADRTT